MAGKAENIKKAWDALRLGKNGLELDPPVSLKDSVYLGCSQREFCPAAEQLKPHADFYQRLFARGEQPPHSASDDTDSAVRGVEEGGSYRPKKLQDAP